MRCLTHGLLPLLLLTMNPAREPAGLVAHTVIDKGEHHEAETIRQDPAIDRSWGLNGTDAFRAWRISAGTRDIVVAVIDTGIDIHHPDLHDNVWTNPGETGHDKNGRLKETNGVDDDGNGFIDDVHGWNFAGDNPDVTDRNGHGTHIAGIIGAVGGNGIGISGVSPRVSLMVLKYLDPNGSSGDAVANTAAAIRYATRMGAHIINYSAGGPTPADDELAAIREAASHNILFVAAAGNERANSDLLRYYPADYDCTNILSVTAFDQNRVLLARANYGETTVDIAAPGKDIHSTLPGGRYGRLSGTSQATAFASGVAALVLAKSGPRVSPEWIIDTIVRTGDADPKLIGKTKYRVRLNTYRALAIEDLGVSAIGVSSIDNRPVPLRTFGELHNVLSAMEASMELQSADQALARGPAGKQSDVSYRDNAR